MAVVRYKSHGLKFELACYRNTVVAWRNRRRARATTRRPRPPPLTQARARRSEKEVDNVLQSGSVYTSVSKGVLANKDDLQRVFGTTDEASICLLARPAGVSHALPAALSSFSLPSCPPFGWGSHAQTRPAPRSCWTRASCR